MRSGLTWWGRGKIRVVVGRAVVTKAAAALTSARWSGVSRARFCAAAFSVSFDFETDKGSSPIPGFVRLTDVRLADRTSLNVPPNPPSCQPGQVVSVATANEAQKKLMKAANTRYLDARHSPRFLSPHRRQARRWTANPPAASALGGRPYGTACGH